MTRWYHAVLLAVLLCLLLVADVARASMGGPSAVEVLGWDPVERKLFVVFHSDDAEHWARPQLAYYLLDDDDPFRPIMDHRFDEDPGADRPPYPTLDRIEELRARLEPLSPVDPVGLELRERLLSVSGCSGLPDPIHLAPCRRVEVRIHWLGQVRELELDTWGMSDVVGAWEVPTGHRLVLYTHLGNTHEQGYQEEIAVLFGPERSEELGTRGARFTERDTTKIRHF
jgi:hypothetical protein